MPTLPQVREPVAILKSAIEGSLQISGRARWPLGIERTVERLPDIQTDDHTSSGQWSLVSGQQWTEVSIQDLIGSYLNVNVQSACEGRERLMRAKEEKPLKNGIRNGNIRSVSGMVRFQ
ncbi:hypothetical protein PoB_000915400 [Plakobranchus ocellatus]|uniref:Uncharacterized protein n=1 Tax=Plakobranchus ocellatus TaxID=259542 RepID=A0AAV3YI43_9GAST|nr:hypothetical protein PoB_000915400 [Plakobranchus ocellatus]